jgi:FtsP/CotA-like multicopper oxidase with cupredoxin domain
MSAETRHQSRAGAGRLVGAAMLAAIVGSLVFGIPAAAKNEAPKLRALPAKANLASTARLAATSVTIDLCAKTNPAWDLGPANVAIWGFALDDEADGCGDEVARLPGPVLGVDTDTITAGDSVTIDLTNVNVPEKVSIVIPGASGDDPPDSVGVAAGGSKSYTFTFAADQPGTFLYQSGAQSAAAQVGIPMGLYGALIVRSTFAGRAYDDPWTAYDSEEVLVLSEIDPALHADPDGSGCAPEPANCRLLNYSPRFWLINGEAYPETDPISADSGDRLLLRYLNAGSIHHGMELLGAHQRVIAKDAFAGYPYQVVAETIPAGLTLDAITTPCVVAGDSELPLSNSNMRLTNGNAGPGGMLTFVNLTGSACPSADNIAPLVDAGDDQTIASLTAALDGTVWDDFVTPVNAMWSGPAGVTFANPADVDTIATFPSPGAYVLTLTASDGTSMDDDTVTITILSNAPPTVDAGPNQTIAFPQSAALNGTVTDDGATSVTTTWSKLSGPGTVTFAPSAGVEDPTASFSIAGTYVLRLTANDGANPAVFDDVTITVEQSLLYFSTLGNVSVPGVPAAAPPSGGFDDADIYAWKGGTNYGRIFDASANGVATAADVDALGVVDGNTFYLSFLAATTLPGVGAVAPQDIVLFDAGAWSMFFDGSDVALFDSAENVDAFEILSATEVVVSTTGNPTVGLTGAADEDLLRCTGSFGPTTTCTWSFYFDASDVGLTTSAEGVDGAAVEGGNLYLTTTGAFAVTGLSGADEDVFRCQGGSRGAATTCGSFSMLFDGSANGVTDDLDAIDRP